MHPQHAIDALFALCEEPSSQESGNSTEPECTSPPRMTKDIQHTYLTPTKFTLSGVKRKTSDDLELIYENSSKKIHVPFKKGESAIITQRAIQLWDTENDRLLLVELVLPVPLRALRRRHRRRDRPRGAGRVHPRQALPAL